MGRQQYLTRLALGRSAFQDQEDTDLDAQPLADEGDPPALIGVGNDQYVQQYDTKGRPINPATEFRNAEMRRAQNSILALVGVVEERERREQSDEMKFRHIREARQATLKDENEVGYHMTVLPVLAGLPLEWSIDCLLKRCIIGLHHFETPFVNTLRNTWGDVRWGGIGAWYAALFPGSAVSILHHFARFLPGVALDQLVIGPLEQVALSDASRKTRRKIFITIALFRHAVLLAIDLAVLPLVYHAVAQQLGLAPAFPLLPPATVLLPWRAESLHNFGWQGLTDLPLIRRLTAPAALLLIDGMFWSDLEEEEETRINPMLTLFRTPEVNVAPETVESLPFRSDPLGWVLERAYRFRSRVLQWLGWTLVKRTGSSGEFEDNHGRSANLTTGPINRYRSTALAHLPANVLANKIDDFIMALLAMPFETLTLRAVASSYMTTNLPKSSLAMISASRLYPLLGFGRLTSLHALNGMAQYVGKIGLCLVTKISTDILIFSSIYRFLRRHAVRNFDWGGRGYIGGITYAVDIPDALAS